MLTLLQTMVAEELADTNFDVLIQKLIDLSVSAGKNILMACIVYFIGKMLVNLIEKVMTKALVHRKVDAGIQTFVESLVHIVLTLLLIISVIGALGVNTTSFAALLASAGVAVGMALSGNLQNFAGGLVVLFFKPYRVGDFIEAQGVQGTVKEIQIFHTILTTNDNKEIFVPNGSMSTSVVTNYNRNETRRLEWTVGIDYGEDVTRATEAIQAALAKDTRILTSPAPFIEVGALADSSVNITVRVWVKTADYWGVHHDTLRSVYNTFNERKINFPYPQQTVHIVND